MLQSGEWKWKVKALSNITDRSVPRHLLLNRDLPLEADLAEDEIVRVLAHVVDHLGDRHRDGGEDDEDGDEQPVEDVSEQEVSGPRALHHQPEVGILDDNVPGNIKCHTYYICLSNGMMEPKLQIPWNVIQRWTQVKGLQWVFLSKYLLNSQIHKIPKGLQWESQNTLFIISF